MSIMTSTQSRHATLDTLPMHHRAPKEHVAAPHGARVARMPSGVGRYQALLRSGEAGSEGTVPCAEYQRALAGVHAPK